MERLVKAMVLPGGWHGFKTGESPHADRAVAGDIEGWVLAGVCGACPGLGVAGRLLGWHDAPGQCGSAARHTDIRGLGPQVGQTQQGAPDYGRVAQATAYGSRGSVLQRLRPGASYGYAHLLGRSRDGREQVRVQWVVSGGHLGPQEPGELPGDRGRHDGLDVLAGCQDPEAGAQALLGCPRPGNNLGFKALLAAGDLHADGGAMLQGPGRPGPAWRAGAHCRPW